MDLLKRSPLAEASCEIVFMPSSTYDLTLPGVVYTQIKDKFPIKKEKPENAVTVPNLSNNQLIDIIPGQITQFFSSDQKTVVQIGKDLLVSNSLAPYQGWQTFKEQVLNVVKIYSDNFSEKPQIRKITLKYINIFTFEIAANYSDIFTFPMPAPPDKEYKNIRAFNTTVEFDTEYQDILVKNFKSIYPPEPSQKACMLELSNTNTIPNFVNIEQIESWLNGAHKSIENLFVNSLKKTFLHKLK